MGVRRWLVAAAVLAAAVLGLAVVLGGGGATAAPTQPAAATTTGVVHHVFRTCSTDGGCGLSLRDQPSASGARVAMMADGDAFTVNCWTRGETVLGNQIGRASCRERV